MAEGLGVLSAQLQREDGRILRRVVRERPQRHERK
jgi:hypothetical protein